MERPGELLTPVQIQRNSRLTSRDSLYRALTRGQQLGLIRREAVGLAGAYRINTSSPLYPEVKLLIDKLSGLFKQLTEVLLELPGCEVGFVFGSVPTGSVRADSDVDVFVIGTLSILDAARVVAPVGERHARQVNVTAYTRQEVEERLRRGDPWTTQVMKGPKQFLFGREDDPPGLRAGSEPAGWTALRRTSSAAGSRKSSSDSAERRRSLVMLKS